MHIELCKYPHPSLPGSPVAFFQGGGVNFARVTLNYGPVSWKKILYSSPYVTKIMKSHLTRHVIMTQIGDVKIICDYKRHIHDYLR